MSRATVSLLIAAGMLASASANSASFSTMPTIHTGPRLNLNVTPSVTPITPVVPITTTDHRGPCYGCGAPPPAAPCYYHPADCRLTFGPTNDQFDTTGNLNPGGGGGGVKSGKKPNAQ
jgi:hypothetical protein